MSSDSSQDYETGESEADVASESDFRSRSEGSGFDEPGAGDVFVEGEGP